MFSISSCNYGSKIRRRWPFLKFWGDTQQIGGVKKTTDFLDNSTWVLASLLLVLILLSNLTIERSSSNIDSKLLDPSQSQNQESILNENELEIPVEIPVEINNNDMLSQKIFNNYQYVILFPVWHG